MPSTEETYQQATALLNQSLQAHGNRPESAWLGVYEALLWYVSTPQAGAFPHIIDANRLVGPRPSGLWQQRAAQFENYLAQQLGCAPDALPARIDRLLTSPQFTGLQRQNPLGIAFIGIIKYLLETFGDTSISYMTEFPAKEVFLSVTLPGRSKAPTFDIAAFKSSRLVAIVSAKWSLRHDRMGDLISECRAYKAAGMWAGSFRYHVVTNEFDAARLSKALSDECFNGVTHVRKEAVTQVCGQDGRLAQLLDLTDLLHETRNW